MSEKEETRLKLGPNHLSDENELWVAGVDLLKLGIVSSLWVSASVGQPTTVSLELSLDHFEGRDLKVMVPVEALRKLAEWSGLRVIAKTDFRKVHNWGQVKPGMRARWFDGEPKRLLNGVVEEVSASGVNIAWYDEECNKRRALIREPWDVEVAENPNP